MAEVTALLVKQLREKTGAGMMECRNALVEANANLDDAEVILRKRGAASAAKKASRTAKQGLIGLDIAADSKSAVIVEVNCESDFVARTDDFQALVAELAAQVAHSAASTPEALYAEPLKADAAVMTGDYVKAKIAKMGENIVVPRFGRLNVESGAILSYVHPGAQLAAIVALTIDAAHAGNEEFHLVGKDIAMQIAAADPKYIVRAEVDPALIAKEADIARDRARNEGKPEKILDKIVEGRLSKYYEEICLTEQPFIKENSLTITELLKQKSKAIGAEISIAAFVRFKVGETQPADEAAAE